MSIQTLWSGFNGATPLLAQRCAGTGLFERLFALQILGDDRSIAFTYILGRLAHRRSTRAPDDAAVAGTRTVRPRE